MKLYIIDYKTVGAAGLRDIEKGVEGDAVFFVTGDASVLPFQMSAPSVPAEEPSARIPSTKPQEKQERPFDKAAKISPDVITKARNAFSKAEKKAEEIMKNKPALKKPAANKPEKKDDRRSGANLSDDLKEKLKEAVKPAGLKAIEYARLYKAFAESKDKNEYNIALSRSFKNQKKANDIYKLTRTVFDQNKGN